MTLPAPATPAFKEWTALVEALGQGHQTLILRKGGIAEGRAGFQPNQPSFWLFPTQFHQQWEKTRPELRALLGSPAPEESSAFLLHYRAEIIATHYLEQWEEVAALRPFHYWGETILRERFEYKDRPGMTLGLHLLIVRVERATEPTLLPPAKAYEGCKSWIQVPVDFAAHEFTPVLSDDHFARLHREIQAALAHPQPPLEAA